MEPKSLQSVFDDIGFGKFQYILAFLGAIVQSCNAIELLIFSFIQIIIHCDWNVSLWENSILTTSVFIGMIIGGPTLGRLGDIYGRKPILVLSSFMLTYIGLVCAASPTIIWITIFRTIVGVCLSGIISSMGTLQTELMPTKNRGFVFILILAFWPIGSYIVTTLCVLIVPKYGWRAFMAVSTLPLLCVLPFLLWLPESPRFLLLNNRKNESLTNLNKIAKMNGVSRITDVLQPVYERYSYMDIFHKDYLSTTFILSILWFVYGLTYYGIILIVTDIENTSRRCLQNLNTFYSQTVNTTSHIDDSCCLPVTWGRFTNIMISTTGEIVFVPVTLVLINVVGRKYSIAIFFGSTAILFVIINICMPPSVLSFVLFVARGIICGTFNIIFLYSSEVFPTSVRSTALGLCNAVSRIGSITTPFIYNYVIQNNSFLLGTMIFTIFNAVAMVAAFLLPFETKSRQLFQTANSYTMLPE